MNYALLLAVSLWISGCGLQPPKVERCSIIDRNTAECVPSDGSEIHDREIRKMLGYQCLSPDDRAKAKAYLKKLVDRL